MLRLVRVLNVFINRHNMTNLSRKEVKIRKPHRCFGCRIIYPVGTKMDYQTNVYDGHLFGLYSCHCCDKIMHKYKDDMFGYGEGFFPQDCVYESMLDRQVKTPEHLLLILDREARTKRGMHLVIDGRIAYV